MNSSVFQVVCSVCNATNVGPQAECLRCHAPLSRQEETPETATCPGCGQQIHPEHKFCPRCGARLQTYRTPSSLTCSQCGRQALPGQKFCAHCGASLPEPLGQ